MISISKPASRSVLSPSALIVWAKWLGVCVTAVITIARNRRQMKALRDLDDYLLADIGLTRGDLAEANRIMPFGDPTIALGRCGTLRPRGRDGDVLFGRVERGRP